ncbi:MAG: cAMP-binding protein, partial [Myxococcaceae bacterium]|nr:cAMP-binding protein [Myxococcaceae bacterium]
MLTGLTEQHFPFLSRLAPDTRGELRARTATRVAPRKALLRRGDEVDGAYLVVRGSLRVHYISARGRDATLYRVEPGGTCILALTSALSAQPYPAWVEAGEEGAAFVRVPNPYFRALLDREAAFREFVFAVLSGRIFELMLTLEEAGSEQLVQRIAKYLVRQTSDDGSVRRSQAGIASDLGTAREVVSRALRLLLARGIITTGRTCITILDRSMWEELATGAASA